MTITLDYLEAITVYAFMEALSQQNEPLPEELQQAVNQVGKAFGTDPKAAVNRLLELATHERLQPIYDKARRDVQKTYEPQERNEYISVNDPNKVDGQPPEQPPELIQNVGAVFEATEPGGEYNQSPQLRPGLKGWLLREN